MVEWDFEKLSVEDALLMATGEVTGKQLFEMLNRASNGGLRSIPATRMIDVIADFRKKFEESINPKARMGDPSAKE